MLPATASAPQAGMALAVGGLSTLSPTGRWVVPPPGTSSSPAVSGAAPESLALANTSDAAERYIAYAVDAVGRPHARGRHARRRHHRRRVGSPARRRRPRPDHGARQRSDGGERGRRAHRWHRRGDDAGHPARRRRSGCSPRRATGCGAGSGATAHGPRPGQAARQQQGEEDRAGEADQALDPGDEAADAVVPRPDEPGLGQRTGGAAARRALAHRHGQGRVGGLAREHLQLALQLLDLGLNAVELLPARPARRPPSWPWPGWSGTAGGWPPAR